MSDVAGFIIFILCLYSKDGGKIIASCRYYTKGNYLIAICKKLTYLIMYIKICFILIQTPERLFKYNAT